MVSGSCSAPNKPSGLGQVPAQRSCCHCMRCVFPVWNLLFSPQRSSGPTQEPETEYLLSVYYVQGALLSKPLTEIESHLVPCHPHPLSSPHALSHSQGLLTAPLNPDSSPFASFHLAHTSVPKHHLPSPGRHAVRLLALLLPPWPLQSFPNQ